MAAFQKKVEQDKLFQSVIPFPEKEMTEQARLRRLKKVTKFQHFDTTYFTADSYSAGYSAPAPFHKKLQTICDTKGVHIVAGPRKHGKSATVKKKLIHKLLHGEIQFALVASETLDGAEEILEDIMYMITQNPRIMSDFKPEILKSDASKEFSFFVPGQPGIRSVKIFSGNKSPKGKSKGLNRPQFILIDDLETRTSPGGRKQAKKRVNLIREAYSSLGDGGTLVCLGNNFRTNCYIDYIIHEKKDATTRSKWNVYIFQAWSKGSLWPQRYPAKTEKELRDLLEITDDSEWNGDYQQKPVPDDGFTFHRPHHEYDGEIPPDAKGVIWSDPNLSLKDEGDTTAICIYLFSPRTGYFYIPDVACRSFSDSNEQLDVYYALYQKYKRYLYAQGWDGHVTQEATWTNFTRNFCTIRGTTFPQINYRKYKVDLLSKNCAGVWNRGEVKIRKGLIETDEGKEFFAQVFAFTKKADEDRDDAPDSMISCHEFIHERGFGQKVNAGKNDSIDLFIFDNYISF